MAAPSDKGLCGGQCPGNEGPRQCFMGPGGSPGCVYGAVNESTQPSDICVLQMRLLCMISSQVRCKTHTGGAGGLCPLLLAPGRSCSPQKPLHGTAARMSPGPAPAQIPGPPPAPRPGLPHPGPPERDRASPGVERFPSQLPARLSRGMHPKPLFSFNYLSVTNLAGKAIKRVGD